MTAPADRRLLKSNGRVAHGSLRGKVDAERFVDGEARRVVVAKAPLLDAPDGRQERELVFGETFVALDTGGGWSVGVCGRDDCVGWMAAAALGAPVEATHVVGVARTYAKTSPALKAMPEPLLPLSFGSRVRVTGTEGAWSAIDTPDGVRHVPAAHLRPARTRWEDPAEVAGFYLGTPYVWGGNSAFGIDCSGLVQAALLACGLPCPPDSDLQAAGVGRALAEGEALRRGDLVFWRGHVAMALDSDRLIHANAHAMAVTVEDTDAAIRRIAEQGDGPVTVRRRPG